MNTDKIQGKEIEVIEFSLSVYENESMITMKFLVRNEVVRMIFHNVSSLYIQNFSMPYQIGDLKF